MLSKTDFMDAVKRNIVNFLPDDVAENVEISETVVVIRSCTDLLSERREVMQLRPSIWTKCSRGMRAVRIWENLWRS